MKGKTSCDLENIAVLSSEMNNAECIQDGIFFSGMENDIVTFQL